MNLNTELNLPLDEFSDLLVRVLHARAHGLFLSPGSGRDFIRVHPSAVASAAPVVLSRDTAVIRLVEKAAADWIDLAGAGAGHSELIPAALRELAALHPACLFPIRSGGALGGVAVIGEKTDGAAYTPAELALLGVVLKSFSRLQRLASLAEELDLVGFIPRGIAHDLQSALTPVSTFLQLCAAGPAAAANAAQLLPVATKNLALIQSCIDHARAFPQPGGCVRQPVLVAGLLRRAVELAEARLTASAITVVVQAPPDLAARLDEVLILRLLGNLLANALAASPPQSTIRLEAAALQQTEAAAGIIRLRITDEGRGLGEATFHERVVPYRASNEPGLAREESGLGLVICRKIAEMHGGSLAIFSGADRGTVVEIDLPGAEG